MTAAAPRVLFLSHSASRNGATILLLEFLRWLRPQVDWHIEVLMNGRGPLLDEFRAVAPTTVWRDPTSRLAAVLPRSAAGLQARLVKLAASPAKPRGRFDLVYANTAAAAPMVGLFAGASRALLWHVHELDYALAMHLPDPARQDVFRRATRYIAVSRAVRDTLRDAHGIDASRTDVVNGFIAPGASGAQAATRRGELRARLGLADDAFVIGACGSLGWRKGSDLFLQAARHVLATPGTRDAHFLWVGGTPGEPAWVEFEYDLQRLGLRDRCRLVPTTHDARDYYHAMDAFALTSREDPFPLVVLEAAECGLPVLCFAEAGGASEFLEEDTDFCAAPYLDAAAFAARIDRLRADPALASRLGAAARVRVERNHRVERQGPLMLQSMQHCLALTQAPDAAGGARDVDSRSALPTR